MASEARKKQTFSRDQLRKIWKQVGVNGWVEYLGQYQSANKWRRIGDTIKGCCFYHTDHDPSLHVTPEKGLAHCFGNSCMKTVTDPIKFLADMMGVSYTAAFKELNTRYNLKLPVKFVQHAEAAERIATTKSVLRTVANDELCRAIDMNGEDTYSYAAQAVEWLQKRQWNLDTVHLWPIGILPSRERMHARLNELSLGIHYPEIDAFLTKYYTRYLGCMMFFYYTTPDTIGGVRVRIPNEQGAVKHYEALTDQDEENMGYFGLNMYNSQLYSKTPEIDTRPAYILESETDVLAIIAHERSTGESNVNAIGFGGGMERDARPLLDMGFPGLCTIQDNDQPGTAFVTDLLHTNQMGLRIFNWSKVDADVKDVDAAMRHFGAHVFYKKLRDDSCYFYDYEWAIDRVKTELKPIDQRDITLRNSVGAKYANLLYDPSARDKFMDAMEEEDLNRSAIARQSGNISDIRDLSEYLATELLKEYRFLQEDRGGGVVKVTMWHRKKNMYCDVPQGGPRKVGAFLERDLGNLEDYIAARITLPSLISFRVDPKGAMVPLSYTNKVSQLYEVFGEAFTKASADALPSTGVIKLSNGIHYYPHEFEKPHIFIINGRHMFVGIIEGEKTTFTALEEPIYHHVRMDTSQGLWSKHYTDANTLNAAQNIDMKKMFWRLKEMFSTGWRFSGQETTTTFLAANTLYAPLSAIFQRMTLINVSGHKESGKTTLMRTLGNRKSEMCMCDSAIYMDNYSEAAVRRMMGNSSCRLILDEFEAKEGAEKDRASQAVEAILHLVRSISEGSDIVRATSDGRVDMTRLHFPIIVGGIKTMFKAVDISRFFNVHCTRVPGFGLPLTHIRRKFSPDEIAEVRDAIALGLLQHIPEVLRNEAEVMEEFHDNASLPSNTESRFKYNLYPTAAILKMIGEDYRTWMSEVCVQQAAQNTEKGISNDSERLYDVLMNTMFPASLISKDNPGLISVAQMLSNPSTAMNLNSTGLGLYYHPQRKWVTVFWDQIPAGLFRYAKGYDTVTHPRMYGNTLIGHNDVVTFTDQESLHQFILESVAPLVGTVCSNNAITVLDVSNRIYSQTLLDSTAPEKNNIAFTQVVKTRTLNDCSL